jgi:peptidylprolyl isomerase
MFPVALNAADAAGGESLGRLGSVELTADELQITLDALGQDAREAVRRSPHALQQVVRNELLRKTLFSRAKAAGWERRPEVVLKMNRASEDAVVSALMNDLARAPRDYPPEDEIRAFYELRTQMFQLPRRYQFKQIFFAVNAADDEAAIRKQADEMTAVARKNPGDFAARVDNATGQTRNMAQGDNPDWIAEDQLIPEVRSALQQLAPGMVAGPLRSAQGWHVIRLLATKPGEIQPLEQVRPSIVAMLRLQQAQRNEARYIEGLLKDSPPRFDDAALKRFQDAIR